ncbi:MAG: glycosyltransferase [Pseudomonadota bacterium]
MENLLNDPSRASISLAVAVRNGARYIEQALTGINAQTRAPDEIVLINDGSQDATLDILNRFRDQAPQYVQVISQPQLGLAAARNAALTAATTTWQIILDADDVPGPALVEKMASVVETRPQTALAFCRVRYVDQHLTPTGVVSPWPGDQLDFTDFLRANPMHSTSGTILRRDAALAVGAFDETLTAMADVDMAVRIGQAGGRLHAVDEVVVDYRKHKGQVTSDWRRLRDNWERLFEKARVAAPKRVGPLERTARAENAVFWATMAYQAEEFRDARQLMRRAWIDAPGVLARKRGAWMRSAACLATRLPRPLHDALQRGVNAVGRAVR